MNNSWKKYLIRHSFFTYGRDSLIFFVNLYLWSQVEDLKIIALFNIVYLGFHTLAFVLFMPLIKSARSQKVMRSGIAGLALVLATIAFLQESIIDYVYIVALFTGIFNGAYWSVNHVEALDMANNASRASFLSFRNAFQGLAKLAVPGVGWLVFTAVANDTLGYSIIFGLSMLSMIFAWTITEIVFNDKQVFDLKKSLQEFKRTKFFGLKMINGVLFGVSLRSALAVVLLPFLIFQVVERESSLSFVQTTIEILALLATFYFASHKKNTDYITRLFYIGAMSTIIGLTSLLIDLNITTYLIFIVTFVIALKATNIASGTMSSNFSTTINEYNKHKVEYVVIREIFAITGFISGYVFVYFFSDLSIDSLRPLLITMIVATLISLYLSLKLWKYVLENDKE